MANAKKKSSPDRASYPALPIVQNDQRFFFTTIPVSSLFPYCFVAQRQEDPKEGFQRRLNENRAIDIANYLNAGTGSIPTNVVLSAQDSAEVVYNSRSKLLSYAVSPGSFLVLDGQHRLWGYELCRERYDKDLRVPVSIYLGLTRAQEARLFIDINTTQVGVPSALLLDIKQVAEIESSAEQVLRGLFDFLNEDTKSPFKRLLSPAKSVTGKISRVTFNRALAPVIRSNVWKSTSRKSQFQLVINYTRAFSSVVDDISLMTKSAFFESLFEVFDDVVETSISKHGDAKEASISAILAPLGTVDLITPTERARATKATYVDLIRSALKQSVSISDSMV